MDDRALPIFHLTAANYYYRQAQDQPYRPETFAQEGFIHCTGGSEKLVEIANSFFADLEEDLLVLEIDPSRLTAPLKFEPPIPPAQSASIHDEISVPDPGLLFPHIYGPLNREAIIRSFALLRDEMGRWRMPGEMIGDDAD
jgi:uncharacterized protein (DUF952 family)